jgi:2-methylcitrate dehydratase PrpD
VTGASNPPAALALGNFVTGSDWADLPDDVHQAGRRSLLNFVGCALGVASEPAVESAIQVMKPIAGTATGESPIFARRERMDAMSAAFVNAIAGNLLDYDDTHLPTVIHPSAPVAPPVLALAQARGASGAEALAAFILGVEVACRLGNSVTPGHYARGWHITATCGVFGAAAGCARLLGLDAGQTAHALGIAASQAGGIVENLPTAAKNVGVGNAARNGMLAALFAGRGYEAAAYSIEGRLGWARASGDDPCMDALLGDLGSHFEAARNTFKPYPAGIVMHAVVDACLALREQHGLTAEQIQNVQVSGDALLLARGDRAVGGERDGRVSVHHAAASAFLWGRAGVAEYAEASVMSPEAVAFRGKVSAELDASMGTGAARVKVTTLSGARHEATVEHARGSLQAPLSDDDIETKVRDLAALGGSRCDVEGLIQAAWTLDEAASVDGFMQCTRPG